MICRNICLPSCARDNTCVAMSMKEDSTLGIFPHFLSSLLPSQPPSNHRGGHSKAKLIPLLAGARDGTLTENKAKGRNTSSGTRWTPGIAPNSGIQFSHKTVNHNSSTHFSPLFGKTAFISRSGARPVGTDRPAHNKSRETARV